MKNELNVGCLIYYIAMENNNTKSTNQYYLLNLAIHIYWESHMIVILFNWNTNE